MIAEYASVGAPNWEAIPDAHVAVHQNMILDKGSENVGATKRALQAIVDMPRVSLTVVWCMYHQSSRVDRSVLLVCDTWRWCDKSAAFPVKYYSGVSAIIRVWRSPGFKIKLIRTVERLFPGDPLKHKIFLYSFLVNRVCQCEEASL